MAGKTRYVSNPLTVIGMFSAMSETAFVCSIKLVNPEFQYIFIWFTGIFPILLILLFFSTLIFKPKVLYSPKDFKDEQNFLRMMEMSNQKVKIKRN